jgi:hypothetical protein
MTPGACETNTPRGAVTYATHIDGFDALHEGRQDNQFGFPWIAADLAGIPAGTGAPDGAASKR